MTEPGIYKHYKGGTYTVLFVAVESTNGSRDENRDKVVYVSHKTGRISIRLESEFHEKVEVRDQYNEEQEVPRFEKVAKADHA